MWNNLIYLVPLYGYYGSTRDFETICYKVNIYNSQKNVIVNVFDNANFDFWICCLNKSFVYIHEVYPPYKETKHLETYTELFLFLGRVTESSSGFFLDKRFPIGLGLNLFKNLIVIIICEKFLPWIIWNRMIFFKKIFAEFFSFFSLFQLFVYLYSQYTQFSCFWMYMMNNAITCHCFFLSHEN